MEKIKITKGSVEETLVIPLYGRKIVSERFPELFEDKMASTITNRLDYDFSELKPLTEKTIALFGSFEIAIRQKDIQTEVENYLKVNPNASVVNLGCGLDFTAENIDNGKCKIYNIDLPDVIRIREKVSPSTERIKNLCGDLANPSFLKEIDLSNGAVFFASGVFFYLTKSQVINLIREITTLVPKGQIIFDTANKIGTKVMTKSTLKKFGITRVKMPFYLNNPEKELRDLIKNGTISSKKEMTGYSKVPTNIHFLFPFFCKLCDNLAKTRIVKIEV